MATIDSPSSRLDLEDVLESLKPKARRIFARYRIPPADAEDLLQESFVVFLHKQHIVLNTEAWLVGTLRKRCLVYWRTRRRRLYNAVDTAILESIAQAEGPSQESTDLTKDLSCALSSLSERCKSILRLRYGLGCTPIETAERMGYRRSSIYKVMERCMAALTTRLVASGLLEERETA